MRAPAIAIDSSRRRQGISFLLRGLWWSARSRLPGSFGRLQRGAPKRLMYVFDYGSAVMSKLETSVQFREQGDDQPSVLLPTMSDASSMREEHGCVVGSLNGRIVYRAWYVRSSPERLQGAPRGWSARGRVLFLHGGTTDPEFRGRGIHSAATQWLLRQQRAPDVEHAACFVHADNRAARRTVERAGFRLVGTVDE